MTNLPESWQGCAIADVTVPVETISADAVDRPIAYIDISSIDNVGNRIAEPKRLLMSTAPSRARQIVKAGDVLFATVRPYLRNIARVPESLDGQIASTGFAVLRAAECVLPAYLFYKCISRDFVAALTGEQYGVSYPAVKEEQVRSQPFELPPLPEQHRIVAKIEALFSELDKAVESLTLARAQLKTYRQALLKHAFEGKLTADWRSPNMRWRNTTIGDEIVFLTSGSRGWADYYADEGETFIRAQNLKHDRLDLTDIAYVKLPPGNSEGMRTRVKVGDVLVTITGANVTKTGILTQDIGTAYVSQHVALCRPGNAILPEFLYWYLLAETGGRRQLNESAYGAGKPGLNLENIREVSIALPEREEQIEIVARINSSLSIEENLRHMVETELQRVSALRQSILKQAFSGQLVAQDPADEPASALLARRHSQSRAVPAARKRRA